MRETMPVPTETTRFGFWNDYSGATHRVEILAETTDGRYVVEDVYGIGQWLVKKEDITLAEEGE